MSDVSPDRIAAVAAAARVPIADDAPARIARATSPAITRFAAENIALELEIEPSTFVAMQRKDAGL